MSLRLFRFFLFLLFFFIFLFLDSDTCWGIEIGLSILKIKLGVVPIFLSGVSVSRGELLRSYLVINITGSVWGKFELHLKLTCFLELLAAAYLRETNISVFLYLINGYLFFGCLEKVLEEEKNENKIKEEVEVLQQASYRRTRTWN